MGDFQFITVERKGEIQEHMIVRWLNGGCHSHLKRSLSMSDMSEHKTRAKRQLFWGFAENSKYRSGGSKLFQFLQNHFFDFVFAVIIKSAYIFTSPEIDFRCLFP